MLFVLHTNWVKFVMSFFFLLLVVFLACTGCQSKVFEPPVQTQSASRDVHREIKDVREGNRRIDEVRNFISGILGVVGKIKGQLPMSVKTDSLESLDRIVAKVLSSVHQSNNGLIQYAGELDLAGGDGSPVSAENEKDCARIQYSVIYNPESDVLEISTTRCRDRVKKTILSSELGGQTIRVSEEGGDFGNLSCESKKADQSLECKNAVFGHGEDSIWLLDFISRAGTLASVREVASSSGVLKNQIDFRISVRGEVEQVKIK